MRIPLYNTGDKAVPGSFSRDFNAGLWYDKFCNEWRVQERAYPEAPWWKLEAGRQEPLEKKNCKENWINTVCAHKKGGPPSIGDGNLMGEAYRRRTLLARARQGQVLLLKTEDRFVTGMGRQHPVENGFAWHHLLGAPYLPGSTVKGMVRAWAENWLSDSSQDNKDISDKVRRIFGPRGADAKGVGSVIFFDALPVRPVRLECDVMTPHYAKYYQEQNNPPGDWYSPVPIPFLTVAKEQTFMFMLAPRRPSCQADPEDSLLAAGWLGEALLNIGAGAKTASGYGRFAPDQAAIKKWQLDNLQLNKEAENEKNLQEKKRLDQERAKELASMGPLLREMEEQGYSSPDVFLGKINQWLERMEKDPAGEGIEIAGLLMKWYREKKPELLNKPNEKNKKKLQRINKVLGKI